MKAVLCESLDGPDSLQVREVPAPQIENKDQVKVDLKARGLSFTDILMSKGEYQVKPKLPFTVGGEAAGVVSEVGSDVTSFAPGDLVLAPGGCVEQVVVRERQLTPLHENSDLVAASSFRSNYQTALYGLQRGRLQGGETLLVHGAAGGVGLAAVDMGKVMGATVIGTASTPEKLEVVKEMGADHVINYTEGEPGEHFRQQVKDLTGGLGADVIYDPVGGDVFDESMRCIAPFGRILIVGFTGGRPALAKTNHVLIKDAEIIGFTIGSLAHHRPEWSRKNHSILMSLLGSGRIRPYVSHQLPIDKVPEGLKLITERKVMGKVVITT